MEGKGFQAEVSVSRYEQSCSVQGRKKTISKKYFMWENFKQSKVEFFNSQMEFE